MSYENFDLHLTWHEPTAGNEIGRVSVKHGNIQSTPAPYLKDLSNALSILMATNKKGMMKKSQLVEAGQQVANLLLPDEAGNSIRAAFRQFWQQQQQANPKRGVRLRLFYPSPTSANDASTVKQRIQLLAIPWEYAYLAEANNPNIIDEKHFLCRNRNLSMVHSFKPPNDLDAEQPMSVDELPVDLAYLSWLGDDPGNQQDLDQVIFDDFADEIGDLNSVINTSLVGATSTNFEASPLPTLNTQPVIGGLQDAEPDDVVQALRDNDLVHLVFHSEPSKIYLKNGQGGQLTTEEILGLFDDIKDEIDNAKAVLLIGCNSGDGGRSIGAALHRVNVPLVVSFTASIHPSNARDFVDGFYRAFAAHPTHALERAVVNGRRLMFRKSDDNLKWFAGFATPRVYLNTPNSVLVPGKLLFDTKPNLVNSFDIYLEKLRLRPKPEFEIESISKLETKVIDWVNQPEKAWFYITGREGIGKSTLIAKLINQISKEHPNRVIYHFCRWNEPSTPGRHPADPLAFIRHSLVPQLQRTLKENYVPPPGQFPLLVGNKLQALKHFVLNPLTAIVTSDGPAKKPIIVIDDVDSFRGGQGFDNSILKLLRDHWGDLINVASFLIAAGAGAKNPFAQDELENLLGAPDQRLTPEQEPLTKVQEIFGSRANTERIISPLEVVGDFSRPVPLVYDIASRFGSSFEFDRKIPLEVAASPQGVNALYQEAIATVFQSTEYSFGAKAQELMDVVATAYEPLFPCDVAALIKANVNAVEDNLANHLAPFLQERSSDEPLILFHDSFETYLQRDIVRRGRLAEIHDQFVAAARPDGGWAKITNWVSLAGTAWVGKCQADDQRRFKKVVRKVEPLASVLPYYVRRYLAQHAYEAYRTSDLTDPNRTQRANEFVDLVCDPAFRTIRLLDVGRRLALEDIRNALRVVYAQNALSLGRTDEEVLSAVDRLLAANDPATYQRLLQLEEQLRLENAGVSVLFRFLGLSTLEQVQVQSAE